jgi:hypothetical protein
MTRKLNGKIAVAALILIVALVSARSIVLARAATAQGAKSNAVPLATSQVEYAAKIVCGVQATNTQVFEPPTKPGNYATAINIHNPNQLTTTAPIAFTKHVVIANEEGTTLSTPTTPVNATLNSDNAMEVDCNTIVSEFFDGKAPAAFFKGFLVILTATGNSLDVVGVYSAQPLPPSGSTFNDTGIALDIVPIAARTISK